MISKTVWANRQASLYSCWLRMLQDAYPNYPHIYPKLPVNLGWETIYIWESVGAIIQPTHALDESSWTWLKALSLNTQQMVQIIASSPLLTHYFTTCYPQADHQ